MSNRSIKSPTEVSTDPLDFFSSYFDLDIRNSKRFACYLIVLVLVLVGLPLFGGEASPMKLGSGEPGLKVIFESTNRYVIFCDEASTVGPGLRGGYFDRNIEVLADRNFGLRAIIQGHKWRDIPNQLYPFDDQRVFTCEFAKLGPDPGKSSYWPHQVKVFSSDGYSLMVQEDVYVLAQKQYALRANQYFLGRLGTNIFYWEMGDPQKAYYRSVEGNGATKYFELPKGMLDLFGVAKSTKKDVGFVVFKTSTELMKYSPATSAFIEFSFDQAKPFKNDAPTGKH